MRTRRAQSRTKSRYASVVEHLESRYLLSGAGDLVGDTRQTAANLGTLSAVQPLEVLGTIDAAFDRDVFQFQAGAQETATIELSANASVLDTIVTLFDSSGNQVATNDDFGSSTNSRLTFTVTSGTTYFVEARGFSTSIGNYLLRVSLDAGDVIGTATNLGVLSVIQPFDLLGTIDAAFDRDVYQFQAGTSESTTISLAANLSSLDTVVTLLDSSGNVIASNDDFGFFSTNSQLTATVTGGS